MEGVQKRGREEFLRGARGLNRLERIKKKRRAFFSQKQSGNLPFPH